MVVAVTKAPVRKGQAEIHINQREEREPSEPLCIPFSNAGVQKSQ